MSDDRGIPGPGGDLPPAGDVVTLTRPEYESLLARSHPGVIAREDDRTLPEADGSPTAKGEAAGRDAELIRELDARERRVAELERAYRSALRDRALAVSLCGRPLVPGAAAQLIRLWCDDFDVSEEAGEPRVSSRDGRAVDQAVGDRLASAEYAHFCLPSSRGGAGPREAHRSTPPGTGEGTPRNLGEAIVMQWRKEAVTRANDPNRPIGLGRRR